jgi:ABC-2 type transport system permease protein
MTRAWRIIFQRELGAYFSTPLALVFIVIFLVLSGFCTFEIGGFFYRGQADLSPFFSYHVWLYLFLVPALSMRIWAEERKSGTLELLFTLPVTVIDAVVGKFLAAWAVNGLALLLTFPVWWTVNYLGSPDNGVVLAAYLGSWFMSGSFLAIGCCLSACTRSQVVAFILSMTVCLVFVLAGNSVILNSLEPLLSVAMLDLVAQMGFMTHFDAISRGVLDIRDFLFFLLFIIAWLIATWLVIEMKRAG